MSLCVAEISLRCSSHAFAPLRNMMLNFHNNHNSQILFVQTHTCVYVQTCLCALRLIQARAFRNMLSHFQSPSLALPKAFRTSCVHFGAYCKHAFSQTCRCLVCDADKRRFTKRMLSRSSGDHGFTEKNSGNPTHRLPVERQEGRGETNEKWCRQVASGESRKSCQ